MLRVLTVEAKKTALNSLRLDRIGLEISPLYMPVVKKDEGKVMYVDYCSAEESRKKHSSYQHADILEVDYIWKPGTKLHDCIPNQKFHWVVSSHVLEHIPNPLSWLNQILEVLEINGVFSLILPDKRYCYDKFRRLTETSDVIDNWMRDVSIPSPLQIYDFLSRSVDGSGARGERSFDHAESFEGVKRNYSDKEALNFAIHSFVNHEYLDIHCSVFTRESFIKIIEDLISLELLCVDIVEHSDGDEEFFIKLQKRGDPKFHASSFNNNNTTNATAAELKHLKHAYAEAIAMQEELKKSWLKKIFAKIIHK